jgi:hypothetical protein
MHDCFGGETLGVSGERHDPTRAANQRWDYFFFIVNVRMAMTNIANIITSLNEKYIRHPSSHRGLPYPTAVRSCITIIA